MKKEYIIGAVALVAAVGGYFWWKSKNKTEPQTEPTPDTPKRHPLEGKNIALKGADGDYGGGAVYRIKNGKKMSYGNNQFESGYGINWDKYCEANTDCNEKLVLVSQDVLDALPDAPKPPTTTVAARGLNTSSTVAKGVNCGRSEVKTVTPSGYTYCQKQDSTFTIYDPNGNQIK